MTQRPADGRLPSEIARLGSRVGPYRLLDVVGRGGMGVVYRALAPNGTEVAVKLMLPDLAVSDEYRERFVREAELGPRLRHPHIVEVIDAGDHDGELFLAMRLIKGPNLKAVLQEAGPLPKGLAVGILEQAAEALDFAHQSGAVHLDVKPQNILLEAPVDEREAPHAYVTDFGLLRPTAGEHTTTRSGQIFGSIAYISPEQVESLPVDGRADVYAIACVAYECLTGEIPFDRPNEVAVLWAHVHEAPPAVSRKRHDLPAGIDDVFFTALSKRPEDRFLTCGDFVQELLTASARKRSRIYPIVRPLVNRTPRQRQPSEVWAPNFFPELARVRAASSRPNWAAYGVLGAMLASILVIQLTVEGGLPRAVSDTADAVSDLVPPVVDAFAGDEEEGREKEEVSHASEDEKRSIAPPPRAARPPGIAGTDFSDDPRALPEPEPGETDEGVLSEDSSNRQREETTGSPDPDSPPLATLTAGVLSFKRGDNIFVMQADGSDVRPAPDTVGSNATPTTSPDGKRIAYYSSRDRGSLYMVGLGGGSPRRLTPIDNLADAFPHWSPDGGKIVYVSTDDWSNDTYEIKIIDVATRRIRTLTQGRDPAWSPDGQQIAFERNMDVYVINADGSGETRITNTRRKEWHPNWAPDGKSLVFGGSEGETDYDQAPVDLDVYMIRLADGTVSRLTSTPGRIEGRPCWLSDGSGIAVEALDVTTRNFDIWVISPSGGNATNLTRTSANEAHVDCGW